MAPGACGTELCTIQLDARNKLGATSLMVAAMKGHTKMVKLLLKLGATPDLRGADNWGALGLSVVCVMVMGVCGAEVVPRWGTNLRLPRC